jgi:hypothetical protein
VVPFQELAPSHLFSAMGCRGLLTTTLLLALLLLCSVHVSDARAVSTQRSAIAGASVGTYGRRLLNGDDDDDGDDGDDGTSPVRGAGLREGFRLLTTGGTFSDDDDGHACPSCPSCPDAGDEMVVAALKASAGIPQRWGPSGLPHTPAGRLLVEPSWVRTRASTLRSP